MKKVVLVAAKRTAIGSFLGTLSSVSAHDLGATVIKALLEETKLDASKVDEVILGQVLQAGMGQNPARQASLAADIPQEVPSMTINKVCGSGLKAVQLGAQAIALGDAEIVIAGGQESMSQAPHIVKGFREGQKMGDGKLQDSILTEGLTCAMNGYHMGITAENLAKQFDISKQDQDAFAFASQQKATKAQADGKFKDEIVDVVIPQRKKNPIVFNTDEYIKTDAQLEKITKLRPAFDKEGSVSAGNASGINDGAAALVLMSEDKAKELGLNILATIKAFGTAGVDPSIMGIGPVPAVKQCLQRAGWGLDDVDLIEANEAFAVQSLSVAKELGLNADKVNVNGGAIALGHPIGASGARVLVTLLHEMQKSDAKKGLATLCIGGGQGIAIAVER